VTQSLQQLGLWVALALVFGIVGSALIARHHRGIRAAAGFLLLTSVPYVVALTAIAVSIDRSLTAREAQYNGQMAFALFVIGFTVPWIAACLIGAFVGRRLRRSLHAVGIASEPTAPDGGAGPLPDWRHADNPALSLAELEARLGQIADRHGFSRNRLPECGMPRDGEGTFIDRDKFDYLYGYYERGQLSSSHASVIADELCYRVFYDLAYSDALNRRASSPRQGVPFLVQVREELDNILSRIDPRWAAQAVLEQSLRETAGA